MKKEKEKGREKDGGREKGRKESEATRQRVFRVHSSFVCVCAKSLSRVHFCVTPWTVAHVRGILQARILEWVAMPSSRIFTPRNRAWVSSIGRWILYH